MPFQADALSAVEATYGLLPGEVEDLEPMFRRGDSDEQIASFIAAAQAHRMTVDQYLTAVRILRGAFKP